MRVLLFCAALCLLNGAVFAEDAKLVLTLQDCVERAVKTSLSLQKNAIDLEAARVKSQNVWAELFPSITVGAKLSYSDSVSKSAASFPNDVKYTVPITASITLPVDIGLTIKLSRIAYEQGALTWQNAERAIRIGAARDFYSLLVDEENIAYLAETFDIAQKQLQKSETQFRSGLTNELALLRSRLSMETARFNLEKAKRDRAKKLLVFLEGAGFKNAEFEGREIVLEGAIDIEPLKLDADALIAKYLPRRVDIQTKQKAIEQAEIEQMQSSFKNRGPTVSLNGDFSETLSNTLGGKDDKEPWKDSFSAGLSVSIPLDGWIPGTKNAQTVKKMNDAVKKAQLDLVQAENTAKTDIRSIVEDLENTASSLAVAELRASIAERAFAMSRAAFERGALEILDYENQGAALQEARKSVLDTRLSYQNLILNLETALNADFADITSGK